MALVTIIAVPILLGYALNLSETTETDYRATDDPINVTQLLQTDTAYSYTHSDTYTINTNFKAGGGLYSKILPDYTISGKKSSFPMSKTLYTSFHPSWGGASGIPLYRWSYLYFVCDYSGSGGYVVGNYCDPDGVSLQTINRLHSFYYDPATLTISYKYYTNAGSYDLTTGYISVPDNNYRFGLTDTGSFNSDCWAEYILDNSISTYVDFAAGYRLQLTTNISSTIVVPQSCKTVLMTIDLDTITDPNYTLKFAAMGAFYLEKTTDGLGNVTWTIRDFSNNKQLYYDPAGDNVYQLWINADFIGATPEEPDYYATDVTYDFRYIGSWPSLIGEANYYQNFTMEKRLYTSNPNGIQIDSINLDRTDVNYSSYTPIIRMDDAYFRAFQYNVIQDKTYTPSSFKTNPSTKITNIQLFGNSIDFGGNNYAVTGGKITLGTQQIPVDKLTFNSIFNEDLGGYDNMIGNTFISNTPEPSTITLNGRWSANVSTQSIELYTYTKTEWHAGEFGWDGIDQNFLIVGLITCLGVFVGLGIYARKSRSGGIIPLMIVTGCAAAVFFIML